METNDLIKKFKAKFTGSTAGEFKDNVTVGAFGKTQWPALWTTAKVAPQVIGELLTMSTEVGVLSLENLACIEVEGDLVLSYFFSIDGSSELIVVRVALESNLKMKSIGKQWPLSLLFEQEIEELFGVKFVDKEILEPNVTLKLLPGEWFGHPLRKEYLYPSEFYGVHHMRPAQATAPDEFGVVS